MHIAKREKTSISERLVWATSDVRYISARDRSSPEAVIGLPESVARSLRCRSTPRAGYRSYVANNRAAGHFVTVSGELHVGQISGEERLSTPTAMSRPANSREIEPSTKKFILAACAI